MAPMSSRADDSVQGHWLLARLGKRVLRPGGVGLTRTMLAGAEVTDADVLELAPGLGRTAAEILNRQPRSYVGAEQDPDAADSVRDVIAGLNAGTGTVRVADAADTGLPDASRDVVLGEAMLTMQGDATKHAIVAEAARVLRPRGRYAIHELALTPDTVPEEISTEIRQALARAIKVNARPLTIAEWSQLLSDHGLIVDRVVTAPMALLQPRRIIADEGLLGALRFARNLLLHPDARKRVLTMRHTFRKHRDQLTAVAIIARKPEHE
ncbi:class I SAM-dependent methyltransferase [Mycobacterium montefiorense]|uniref:Methyltransferase n=1 Tax=Mycobacterium montefiorense TaxID=154654 RepID=A0AA37V099_9MYCO|nr:class I SAM-dependent methyltransferase [Mycobacterium montefiorense]GBG38222.1 methyltransferase [Mycobacterium montefiorense]GKU37582.1 methyltransferase [Mycobacterium montefiorense]GKU41275.1 methyltransferase [Mycobacterium montefiorense]GKU44502.1 methyltransferase [Mycobacterium montefiorense]GKU52590.1 methyltransferase [Mycobacterium montefiorense]